MQWMDEHHVPVDRISGTSMGALVGALIASGDSPEDIERLANSDVFNSLFALKPSLAHVSYRRREDRTEMPGALAFGMKKGNVTLGSGLISDDQLNAFLTRELVSYSSSDLNYDDHRSHDRQCYECHLRCKVR
jgi:NTE family protein